MEQYKPSYLGKVIPASDPVKLTEFCTSQFGAFSKLYEICKNVSEKISDLKPVDNGAKDSGALSVKITADPGTVDCIKAETKTDSAVSISGDVITTKSQ